MGRRSTPMLVGERHYVRRVPLVDGYDPGGAYWGCNSIGHLLFVAHSPSGGEYYLRATHRQEAREKAKAWRKANDVHCTLCEDRRTVDTCNGLNEKPCPNCKPEPAY
jgi:hypothetical protein